MLKCTHSVRCYSGSNSTPKAYAIVLGMITFAQTTELTNQQMIQGLSDSGAEQVGLGIRTIFGVVVFGTIALIIYFYLRSRSTATKNPSTRPLIIGAVVIALILIALSLAVTSTIGSRT